MLSILDPKIAVFLSEVGVGLWPYSVEGEATPRLVIKASKEMMLAAKMNGGFKIYVFPLKLASEETIGMISAFFDDADEPLVIFTQLFAEHPTSGFVGMLQAPTLDIHFFDEQNREWLGYTCSIKCPDVSQKRLSQEPLLSFTLSRAREAHTQLGIWFGLRTEKDDADAISVEFRESHYDENLVVMDARPGNHLYPGGPSFSFTQLERREPGALQEQDIAHLLARLFDPRDIYMNPLRVADREEIADILVITESDILVIQAKDSPNTEEVLRNTITRKKATARKSLAKAINQVRGALRYMKTSAHFEMLVGSIIAPVEIGDREVRALVVVKELFSDEFGAYSPLLLRLSEDTDVPVIALDYAELQSYTSMSSTEKFFEAFDRVSDHGQRTGEFPRLRIWLANDEELDV